MKWLSAVAAWLFGMSVQGADLTISWTFPTNKMDGSTIAAGELGGAKVYYGTASSNYVQVVDVPGATPGAAGSCILTGLTAKVTYYVNGTCYNADGLESDFCNEVVKKATTKPGKIKLLAVSTP